MTADPHGQSVLTAQTIAGLRARVAELEAAQRAALACLGETASTGIDLIGQVHAATARADAAETLLAEQAPNLAALHAATKACGYGVNINRIWQRLESAQAEDATDTDRRASLADIAPLVHTLSNILSCYIDEREEAAQVIAETVKDLDAAEKRAAELEWIENTSCCGSEAGRYGVRARAAEAAVGRVRALAQTGHLASPAELLGALDAAGTPNSQLSPTSANTGSWAVTDAMVQAAINAALDHQAPKERDYTRHRRHLFHALCDVCQLTNEHPEVSGPARERVFRAALEAALTAGTPDDADDPLHPDLGHPAWAPHLTPDTAGAPDGPTSTPPHTGRACPDRIETTGWGDAERTWICGCDPRPDAG